MVVGHTEELMYSVDSGCNIPCIAIDRIQPYSGWWFAT